MQIQGITWHAVVLEADEFAATKKLVTEVFGLTSLIEQDGWALFPMSNGTILDLYAPEHVPTYGFNDGIVFGFRVDDVEAASAELAAAGCELLGEITRIEGMKYAFRHFKGPDGRVYGINEQKWATRGGIKSSPDHAAQDRRGTTSAATMPDESILGGGNALRVCGRPGLPKIPLSDPARPLRQQSFLDLLAQVVDIVLPHQDLDAVQIVDACCRLTPEFSCSVR